MMFKSNINNFIAYLILPFVILHYVATRKKSPGRIVLLWGLLSVATWATIGAYLTLLL